MSISVFCLAVLYNVSGQTTPQEMLNKAIYQEEVNGNLEEAIKIFLEIVDKNPTNRAVTVEALYHLGLTNEKLGNKKAREYYDKIVTNFADQHEFVKVARERLNRLLLANNELKPPPKLKFTKIEIPAKPGNGVLSPDGKKLAFTSEDGVWVVPLHGNVSDNIAGEPVRLANVPGAWNFANTLAWSADGKWIAVNGGGDGSDDVYIVPVAAGEPRKIQLPARGGGSFTYRLSLSPDGENLAFSALNLDNLTLEGDAITQMMTRYVYVIPSSGGEPRKISSGPGTFPSFSPDGRLIAYVTYYFKQVPESNGRATLYSDLWVVDSSGGTPIQLASAEGLLAGPIWSPNKTFLAMQNKIDAGGKEILIYQLSPDGSGVGEPVKIALPGYSQGMLAGWTPENELGIFIRSSSSSAVYTVPSSGGRAVQVTQNGVVYYPRWSPDGKRIFLRWARPDEDPQVQVVSVPASGGKVTKVPWPESAPRTRVPGGGQNISPDGRKMVISAVDQPYNPENNMDIRVISLDNGSQLRLTNDESHETYPCWSPDGLWIAFVDQYKTSDNKGFDAIFRMPAEGGDPFQITSEKDSIGPGAIAFSPDGKLIAFFSEGSIKTIPAEGGKPDVLVRNVRSSRQSQLAWCPDGSKIAYNVNGKIWITKLAMNETTKLQTGLSEDYNVSEFGWSPDGERITFMAQSNGTLELWLINNFLPPEKLQQKPGTEIAEGPEGIKIRQVWTGSKVDNSGKVSADGKYLSFTNWETGNLAIKNLKTGENLQLTNEATWDRPQQYAEFSLISPDGKQVAYLWYNDRAEKGYYELKLLQVGNQTSTILYSCSKNEYMVPELWFSDNKKILVQNYIGNTIWQLCSIDITTGEVKVLKEQSKPLWIPNVSLSPDEKYLAFDYPNHSDNGNYDIYLMPVDSKYELPLIEHPSTDRLIGWLPGRDELLFVSDRSGTWDLWTVPVNKGKPSGIVKRVYADIGEAEPMGFSHSGDCFLSFHRSIYTASIVPFNIETGVAKEESGKSLTGSNTFVKWSPDGKYLVYTKENVKTNNPWQLTIQDLRTGEERKVANNLLTSRSVCWSPDGNSILVIGHDKTKFATKGYKGGVFLIDVKTGQTTEIMNISDFTYNATEDEAFPLSDVEWSSDGKSIFYTFFNDRLVKRDLVSGEEKILFKHDRFVRFILHRSPDGKNLLFSMYNREENKSHLFTIPVNGGKEKEICASQEARAFNAANWSIDGNYIFFIDSSGNNLWRVPAEGGIPQKVWYSENKIQGFSIHPKGTQIVLEMPEDITELRVIENLFQEMEKLDKIDK